MKKGRFLSVLLSIFLMLTPNILRADDIISQFRILGGELSNSAATSVSDMQHIAEKDPQHEVVIMMQIENEIGMLESARDHSPLAEKAYKQPVPQTLLKALGIKKKGTWSEVFGTSNSTNTSSQSFYPNIISLPLSLYHSQTADDH